MGKNIKLFDSEIINNLLKKDKNAIDIPKWIAILFKRFLFKKVDRKNENGRCITCDARNLCGGKFRCKCDILQQYEIRNIFKLFK